MRLLGEAEAEKVPLQAHPVQVLYKNEKLFVVCSECKLKSKR